MISASSFLPLEFVTKASSLVTVSDIQHNATPHKTHAKIPIEKAGLVYMML